jgi:hypothetical protein
VTGVACRKRLPFICTGEVAPIGFRMSLRMSHPLDTFAVRL